MLHKFLANIQVVNVEVVVELHRVKVREGRWIWIGFEVENESQTDLYDCGRGAQTLGANAIVK